MYTSATNIGVIKPRRVGWTGSVARFGRTDRHAGFGWAIWKERDLLEDLRVGDKVTWNEYAFCAANMNNVLFRNETGVPSRLAEKQFDLVTERSYLLTYSMGQSPF